MKRGSSLRFIEWPMPQILASVFGVFISPMAFSWRAQRIFSAAYCTALTMFTYPVQRHRLPAIASRICCSLGFLFEARNALVVMSMPGVQKPHCSPCFSTQPSCTACSFPPCSRPSTVVTLQPSACTASTVHDFTGWPSRWTVHAPQWLVSQPTCVPVILKFSRMRSEEHTSELQSHRDLHSFPTRRSSDLGARLHRLAVEVDGARAAVAGVAADVRAGHLEIFPDEVHQQQARLDFGLAHRTVDGDADLVHGHVNSLPRVVPLFSAPARSARAPSPSCTRPSPCGRPRASFSPPPSSPPP